MTRRMPLIRPAELTDAEAVKRVETDADSLLIALLEPHDWPPAAPAEERFAAPGFVLVAEADGAEVAGFVHVLETDGTGSATWSSCRSPRRTRGRGGVARSWTRRSARRASAGTGA